MAKKQVSREKTAPLVGIVGMGYVGLPLAREFCAGGAKVLGFDVNEPRVRQLNRGISPLKHIANKQMKAMLKSKAFRATAKMSELS